LNATASEKVDAMARMLVGSSADEEQHLAAAEMAKAQFELLRIRAARASILAEVDLAFGDLQVLQRLAALHRYERYAHTRRRRASQKL
jgi:hypothetical protein